jgi:hypothetical protein
VKDISRRMMHHKMAPFFFWKGANDFYTHFLAALRNNILGINFDGFLKRPSFPLRAGFGVLSRVSRESLLRSHRLGDFLRDHQFSVLKRTANFYQKM